VVPAVTSAALGRERLLALCEGYLSYVERRVFPGGCFFVVTAAEVGGREGRVRERVAQVQQEWRDLLLLEAQRAAQRNELPSRTDPEQLAFELGTMLAGTNIISVLHDDHSVIARARSALRTHLGVTDGEGGQRYSAT
jgi:hypothetical protein